MAETNKGDWNLKHKGGTINSRGDFEMLKHVPCKTLLEQMKTISSEWEREHSDVYLPIQQL